MQPAARASCANGGRLDSDDAVTGVRVLRDEDGGPGILSGLPGSRCGCDRHGLNTKADGGRLCYKLFDAGHGGPPVGVLQEGALGRGRGRQGALVG